jgi:hypothetical protein
VNRIGTSTAWVCLINHSAWEDTAIGFEYDRGLPTLTRSPGKPGRVGNAATYRCDAKRVRDGRYFAI